MAQLTEAQRAIVNTIREFVKREVLPVASAMEHADEYPFDLVERMKEMGLFGATIPEEYGGLGLDTVTYALIIEEMSKANRRHYDDPIHFNQVLDKVVFVIQVFDAPQTQPCKYNSQ